MRYVSLNDVVVGDVMARTLFNDNKLPLVKRGTKLTEGLIKSIKSRGFSTVLICDTDYESEVDDVISQELRENAVEVLKEIVAELTNVSLVPKQNVMDKLRNIVELIINELNGTTNNIVNLVDLKDFDNYTYTHSVNVAVLSLIVGIGLGYDMDKLMSLGIGAILHDIGKIDVPLEVLNKPGKLTDSEFSIIQEHPLSGVKRAKLMEDIGPTSIAVIRQHHEKVDGRGYPDGLKGNIIHEFARIAAIADVYDALTSDRPYRKHWMPMEALENLYGGCGTHFDINLVMEFKKHIAPFPVGSKVGLSDGREGYVVSNKNSSSRPIINCDSIFIDLGTELNLTITSIAT